MSDSEIIKYALIAFYILIPIVINSMFTFFIIREYAFWNRTVKLTKTFSSSKWKEKHWTAMLVFVGLFIGIFFSIYFFRYLKNTDRVTKREVLFNRYDKNGKRIK